MSLFMREPVIHREPPKPRKPIVQREDLRGLLRLQRTAGNAAVAHLLSIQRCDDHVSSGCVCGDDLAQPLQRDDGGGGAVTIPEVEVVAAPPASLRGAVGSVDYYKQRQVDYFSRNDDGDPPAPDYYLQYGDKYAHRFTEQLRPQLSDAGKAWVDRTFVLLQSKIEARRDAQPFAFAELERDAGAFRKFAYDTHPAAYLEAGVCDLPDGDLKKIAGTPDSGDLWTKDGVLQAAITGLTCLTQWWVRARDVKLGEIDPYWVYGI